MKKIKDYEKFYFPKANPTDPDRHKDIIRKLDLLNKKDKKVGFLKRIFNGFKVKFCIKKF